MHRPDAATVSYTEVDVSKKRNHAVQVGAVLFQWSEGDQDDFARAPL
jgi:hypothetical protein